MKAHRHSSGMTLVEMLAALTVLMILTGILAEVFYQASKAAGHGKALAEIYQVDRALIGLMTRDLSGATPDFLTSGENGLFLSPIFSLPPGPYNQAQFGVGLNDFYMNRMLMGGSDFLVLSSSSASLSDKSVAKVFYVLRATGQLIRVTHADTVFTDMDYSYDAIEHLVNPTVPEEMDSYEERRVVAENVERIKFSFLDRSNGAISESPHNAYDYAQGRWVDSWDHDTKKYLPAAVKVEVQLVDHLWKLADDDAISNRNFPSAEDEDAMRSDELFDAGDGEAFTFIVDLPLGLKSSGG